MIGNLLRAGVALAMAPAAAVADVLTLPSSAYDDKAPFRRTGWLLAEAGRQAREAVAPRSEDRDR